MRSNKGRKIGVVLLALLMAFTLSAGQIAVSQAASPSLKKSKIGLTVGEKYKLTVKNLPKGAKVTYSSSKKAVAAVSKKGVIKAKSAGKANIKVTIKKKNKVIKKLTCKVTVRAVGISEDEPYTPKVDPLFSGDKSAKLDDAFVKQTMNFSIDLFKASTTSDIAEGDNVLISSQSVLTDMMMATGGAKGTNLSELEKVMCGDVGFETFRKSLSDMNARMIYSDPVRFHIANSVWIRDDADRIQVKQDFLDQGLKYYNAESYQLPFDEAMVTKVNDWVNDNTLGMIPKLLDKVPSEDDVMHLINALAFEGAWADQYDDYQVLKDQTFKSGSGQEYKVNMLCDKQGAYLKDDNAVGFTRLYKGGQYSFVAILPDEKLGVEGYLKSMTGDSFTKFYNSREYGADVYTRLPEFKYDYNTELNGALQNMGIKEAFTQAADFSGMADTKSGALYIGKVVHKTHIELDKNGTKAAAVTDISMVDATSIQDPKPQINIYLDRPFIYAIVQTETGLPVFMGVVNKF